MTAMTMVVVDVTTTSMPMMTVVIAAAVEADSVDVPDRRVLHGVHSIYVSHRTTMVVAESDVADLDVVVVAAVVVVAR
jgi:hypothetical protein